MAIFMKSEDASLSRRDVLIAAATVAAVGASRSAFAGEGHDHSQHAPQQPELHEALKECTGKGELCVSHCLASFREGDTMLADCASKVHEMLAVCSAMATLVAANSTYAKGMAKICAQACNDCAEECRKHADHHEECRACMETCEAVVPKLEQLSA